MRQLFNRGWEFVKLPPESTLEDARRSQGWQAVDLPHDWLIFQENDLYESSDGWYRCTLRVPEGEEKLLWRLCFDGVYMDCDVLLNGRAVCTHRYGYTSFDAELTPGLEAGENRIMVQVRYRSPNTRWYSGAGIFRDVWLEKLPARHLVPHSLYVTAHPAEGGAWQVEAQAQAVGADTLCWTLVSPAGETVARAEGAEGKAVLTVASPALWSCAESNLYRITVSCGEDERTVRIGLRKTVFDPDRGFLLNGQVVKLHGVCLHHDLGALGAAFRLPAFRRQLRLMKEMGVNALRTSHNPPSPQVLDVCDEEGVLVIDEFADMWELPKTKYDYARFFGECAAEDVRSWVCRDRNHPCVVMWSIGNEIFDTHASERGYELTAFLRDEVRKHDPAGNAEVTFGSNYMPWENTQRCATLLHTVGYNYAEKYYAAHHAAHPEWCIYGSETASALSTRGIYHFPMSANILSDEDLQCSALGNSISAWGTPDMRRCLVDDLNTPYSCGQFLWTGMDYIGEPTPYHTRSSYFGMVDTAGFPKDYFYQCKAAWNPAPMAHIGVYWDWNEGQLIDVPVSTNGAACELFLNGESLGRVEVDPLTPERSQPRWQVPYHPGELVAVAYNRDGEVIARDVRRSFGNSAALVLRADRQTLDADGLDMAFLTVTAVDACGTPVENAADRVRVTVEGPALLLGVDNGDSTDPDGYKTDTRCLFAGKLLVMIGTTDKAGEITVRAEAEGLAAAELRLPAVSAEVTPGRANSFAMPLHRREGDARVPVRRIDLRAEESGSFTPERPSRFYSMRTLPETADPQEITYKVVNAMGIIAPSASAEPVEGGVRVTACGDGEFYLRATCRNGAPHTRIISQLEMKAEGFGAAMLDPYGFITAGLYDLHDGEIGAGNEQGIAFARDGESTAGFTHVDFGPDGSDEITIPVFALNDDMYHITLWMGDPKSGGHVVAVLDYQKPSIWNTYTPETWKLPERFRGVQTVCFSMDRKVHVKGFSFTRQSRAWLPLTPVEADEMYGDSFTVDGDIVRNIGNNVTFAWQRMDFEGREKAWLTLRGESHIPVCSVRVLMEDAQGNTITQECKFMKDEGEEQRFRVACLPGVCTVRLVFLPGSSFDLYGIRFDRDAD